MERYPETVRDIVASGHEIGHHGYHHEWLDTVTLEEEKTIMATTNKAVVGIVMGSDSDWPTMKLAADACAEFDVACETRVMSAHRTPDDVAQYARTAHERGLRVLIAGAGGAAHLAGAIAGNSPLPVIGVPIETKALGGLDSLLSTVQMPGGVPVATVAIGAGRNAGLLAVQILASADAKLRVRYLAFKAKLAGESRSKNRRPQAR